SWSEATHCNAHLRELAGHVKRGILSAGGFPLEFPTISLGEFFLQPTSMLCRNLMAMDVEEMIRGLPIDGVVLLSGCDKTTPAMLMGAASADLPAILLTGGPQLKGNWRGVELGSCTDCRRYWTELRAGRITQAEYDSMESAIYRSPGHCMVMGTASTMAAITEALGMTLPGGAAIPGADARRAALAEQAGARAVQLAIEGVRPSDIMTRDALENAIRLLLAIGGSTNAVIHLTAIAGRVGIDLPLSAFDDLSSSTPMVLNLKPSGEYLMEDLFYAGGIGAVMKRIAPLLRLDAMTVSGKTLGQNIENDRVYNDSVIRTLENPLHAEGGIVALGGSLAPDGAIIKQTAASRDLLVHRGRAVVFEDYNDLHERIDSPDLDVQPDDVLVMKNAGPVGGPGMPEWGFLPLPKKILQKGIRDMVRISDARMSGTAFGTVVVHVAPEAAIGGPLGLVQSSDIISLDVPKRRLDLLVKPGELARRRKAWKPRDRHYDRGYGRLHLDHVLQAPRGCDFDFLVGRSPVDSR
ncbi:MAG: dihydroxy-acid dehydratase, partial [Chloroflexi bacterium]|nr:dihydroxy-acid dehydratase [Chloroflexota bacterium]